MVKKHVPYRTFKAPKKKELFNFGPVFKAPVVKPHEKPMVDYNRLKSDKRVNFYRSVRFFNDLFISVTLGIALYAFYKKQKEAKPDDTERLRILELKREKQMHEQQALKDARAFR